MGWLKNLFKSPTPAVRKPAKPPTTSTPTTTPKMVPCDFIDLTENEAFLICEMMGKEGMSDDSRMTVTERLVEAVEAEIEPPTNLCTLLYWDKHELDAAGLPERLRPLSSKQAQCIISATRKFWKLDEKGDLSEAHLLIEVGLIRPRS